MSKDMLEKLRALKEKRNAKGGGDRYLKLAPEGETKIRLLPAKNPENTFMKEFGEHWIERQRYVCPKITSGAKCPICESVSELYNAGDDESVKLAREYKGRKQHYANVVVLGAEDQGPKIFKFGVKLADRIIDDCIEEGVVFSDPDEGYDYRVIKQKKDGFPNYDRSKPVKQPRALDEDDFEKWMEEIVDIHALIDSEVQTYEEIQAAFAGVDVSVNDVTEDVEKEEYDEDEFLKKVEKSVG